VVVWTLPSWWFGGGGGGLIIDMQNSNILFDMIGGIFCVGWVIILKNKYSELQGTTKK
jgi:hypothetical protein